MKELLWQGVEELAAGLGISLVLATASAIIDLVFGGWKGLRYHISVWFVAIFMTVIAGWACQYYQLPWLASAVIMGATALMSNTIMSVLYHPAIRAAIVERVCAEIRTRKSRRAVADRDTEQPDEQK